MTDLKVIFALAAIVALFIDGVPTSALAASASCRDVLRSLPRNPIDRSVETANCRTLEKMFNAQEARYQTISADKALCELTPNYAFLLSDNIYRIDQNRQRRCGVETQVHHWKTTPHAQKAMDMSQTQDMLQNYASGFTRLRLDQSHGAQVEYNAPNGRNYLWYPGSTLITQGLWKAVIVDAPDGIHHATELCYLYGGNSIDPTSGSRGGKWECTVGWSFVLNTRDREKGDVFGLADHRSVPFVLDGEPQSLSELSHSAPQKRRLN